MPKKNEKYKNFRTSPLDEDDERPKQGDWRTDLNVLCDEIREGKSVQEIALENPDGFHRYGRTLKWLETIALRRKFRTWTTKGIWYHGPGHTAFNDFDPRTTYVKCLKDGWWDGYTGQETVILNDFHGQIKYEEMLRLCDKWPHKVKQRRKEPVPFLARKIIVTSAVHPVNLYDKLRFGEPIDQLLRRFDCIVLPETRENSLNFNIRIP